MDINHIWLFASIVVFFGGIIYICRGIRLKKNKRFTSQLAALSLAEILALALLSVWFISINQIEASPGFLANLLQYFSLDADYATLKPNLLTDHPYIRYIATVYMFLVYSAAPILGGAFIYDIIVGAAPKMKLLVNRRKNLYIFSELNERTLALAKDINNVKKAENERFAIVFTDVYGSKSSEFFAELLYRAKNEGAICLREDILNCSGFDKSNECSFFLLDEDNSGEIDESSNLITLGGLLDIQNMGRKDNIQKQSLKKSQKTTVRNLKNTCKIFIYSNNNMTFESVGSICENYYNQFDENEKKEVEKRISIYLVRDLARTCEYLLKNYPLYESIETNSKKERILRVAIFGNTLFSRELFKTIFWCGQMINTKLHITVIYTPSDSKARNKKAEFENYLNHLSSEIIESCRQPSPKTASGCLRIFENDNNEFDMGDYSEPYAVLSFIETNLEDLELTKLLNSNCGEMRSDDSITVFGGYSAAESYPLYDYDYYYVMNGADLENISFATELRSAILLNQTGKKEKRETSQYIAVVVENDEMSLVAENEFSKNISYDEFKADFGVSAVPVIYTFGSLSERYTWEKAFCKFEDVLTYDPEESQRRHGLAPEKPISARKKIYDTWATEARTVHEIYKRFSIRCWRETSEEISDGDPLKELSWLEHRRWNAFMRTQGFSAPFESIDTVINVFKKHNDKKELPGIYKKKNIVSHLHPCLVEASKDRMEADMCEEKDLASFDSLDWIGYLAEEDYKEYDITKMKSILREEGQL